MINNDGQQPQAQKTWASSPGPVLSVTSTLVSQRLPCPTLSVIGSALGLVGLVSVLGDWVR